VSLLGPLLAENFEHCANLPYFKACFMIKFNFMIVLTPEYLVSSFVDDALERAQE